MFGFFFAKTLPKNFSDVVGSNDSNFIKFINLCIGKGIYFAPSKFEAGFISSKHTKKDIELTLEKIQTIIKKDF
jgi:glutamate-1-semialdehyde 2,1-aminomutase